MKLVKSVAISSALIATSFTAQSEILWSNVALSYLNGDGYKQAFGPAAGTETKADVFTLEHAGAYNWGKSFFFMDRFIDNNNVIGNQTYTEVGLDFSLSNLFNTKLENAVIKDAYLVTQWENANPVNTDNLLAGVGVRWNVDWATFIDTNVYYRIQDKNGIGTENNMQLTTAWSIPFSVASTKWTFDGFFDYATAHKNNFGDVEATFHTQPQIKLDLGDLWGTSNKYYVGMEVDIWRNKYGQKDINETTPQLMVQVNF
ncbi:DUF5020 family protein [Paraferrimonas sp. SM1919]|uniref:DUF5020 family protein n=1 Tax=Paraferrimonas sp. SM1919 TaxID=2662263 RepID=UPI0013D6A7D3|nr:DUF5020 family protein [Paraferrimonas sp. SM1919]